MVSNDQRKKRDAMTNTILKQIADLPRLSVAELKERWRLLYGSDPPNYNQKNYLVKRLAYRIQELAYGGLSDAAKSKMQDILEQHGYDDEAAAPIQRKENNTPLVGTRFIREWNGNRYEVTVVKNGFEYEGRLYRSLSAIAKEITGTHWNGRLFFGQRKAKQ